jgi:curved DNA-binding protein CbpA
MERLDESIPDLYSILGLTAEVCKEENCDEIIQKAYIKKAKKCHPDKFPGRKDIAEVFELITEAYNILRDKNQRKEYNNRIKIENKTDLDFNFLKKQFQSSIDENILPSDEILSKKKKDFKNKMIELNKKHSYNEDDTGCIDSHTFKQKLENIQKERQNQDSNYMPQNLFEGSNFDIKKFNAAFKKIHNNQTSIIPTEELGAWNSSVVAGDYCNPDEIDNLYIEKDTNDGNNMFSKFSKDFDVNKISKEDLKYLEFSPEEEAISEQLLLKNLKKRKEETLRLMNPDPSFYETKNFSSLDNLKTKEDAIDSLIKEKIKKIMNSQNHDLLFDKKNK